MKLPAAMIWSSASSTAPVARAEPSKPNSPRTRAARPIRLDQTVRLAIMVLVSNMSNAPGVRGWGRSKPQSPLLDGENPPAPAAPEDGPCGEAAEKAEAGPGETADRVRGLGLPRRLQGHRSDDP